MFKSEAEQLAARDETERLWAKHYAHNEPFQVSTVLEPSSCKPVVKYRENDVHEVSEDKQIVVADLYDVGWGVPGSKTKEMATMRHGNADVGGHGFSNKSTPDSKLSVNLLEIVQQELRFISQVATLENFKDATFLEVRCDMYMLIFAIVSTHNIMMEPGGYTSVSQVSVSARQQ